MMNGRSTLPLVWIVALAAVATADTVRVDCDGGGDYLTIQEGVDAASEGDTVLVAPGIYAGAGNRGVDFHGTNLVLLAAAGPESTMIDGEGADIAVIRLHAGEDTTSVIRGFTITRADTAIAAVSASPVIDGCVILDPINDSAAVGIVCSLSAAVIRRSHFTWGEARGYERPGIFCNGHPSPTVSRCVFSTYGSGISADWSSPVVTHCEFLRCIGGYAAGAGVRISHGAPVLEDCLFYDCVSTNPWHGYGLAMRVSFARARLTRVQFLECGSGYPPDKTVVHAEDGYTWIDTSLVLEDVVFWGCEVWDSVLYSTVDTLVVSGCTIADNLATHAAIGAFHGDEIGGIRNSIIAYNEGPPLEVGGGLAFTTTRSCIFGNAGGDSLEGTHFENLFTWPLFCDHEDGDLTLRDDSPCLPANNPWGVLMGAYGAGDCGTGIDGDVPAVGDVRMARVHSNPATNAGSTICLIGAPGRSVDLAIYDLAGRRVRTIATTLTDRGRGECLWDLCDDAGKRLASGVYFVEVSSARGVSDRAKVVIIR